MKRIIIQIIILFFSVHGYFSPSYNQNIKSNFFNRINEPSAIHHNISNYYPNNTGNFWEYIIKDTTTLFNQFYGLNFSITKEVLNDTLMPNGKSYKKIKWENVANSVNYLPWYEYHRVDSTGNVFLYYNNQDHLLFDFNLEINQTYPAHLPNHIWTVTNKYSMVAFDDTVQAIEFELRQNISRFKASYTIAENFGIIHYFEEKGYPFLPEGNLWGTVLNGTEYGKMIVKKQKVNWFEFYPLHVGDYWVYEGYGGSIPIINSRRIISDTLLNDGNLYYKSIHIDHTFGYTSYSYERIDSLGNVFNWYPGNNTFVRTIMIKNTVGDTISSNISSNTLWRFNDKSGGTLEIRLYPDLINRSDFYTYGLGLTGWTTELGGGWLKGAFINGVLFFDTTLSTIHDSEIEDKSFILHQNFPNPFNPTTTIQYELKETGFVSLIVYDILGRQIVNLVNETQSQGRYSIDFDASSLSSGSYLYVLRVNQFVSRRKMLILK